MDYQKIVDLFHESNAPEDWKYVEVESGKEVAFLLKDVDLRIESSLTDEHIDNESFLEKWANRFPDPSASSRFYDLYYRNTLLHRFILVSVDGHRAKLPLPEPGGMTVLQSTYKVAEIFDSYGLRDYFPRSGLELSPVRDHF